jgi:hypothetical protein
LATLAESTGVANLATCLVSARHRKWPLIERNLVLSPLVWEERRRCARVAQGDRLQDIERILRRSRGPPPPFLTFPLKGGRDRRSEFHVASIPRTVKRGEDQDEGSRTALGAEELPGSNRPLLSPIKMEERRGERLV